MTDPRTHLIGLLLGTETDWPVAFEKLAANIGTLSLPDGSAHRLATERVTIEPFSLRSVRRYDAVIDRLAWWYSNPREWLKKSLIMDDVYLINNPFTFQSMEKHTAYAAMIRLGIKVPETVLLPYKNPLEHEKWTYTAAQYNQPFDLDAVAESVGYPMYMKPFDGGAWRGVTRINNPEQLHKAYDESADMLMHLQASVDGFDIFARSLTIGPTTMTMKFQPDEPMHNRYAVEHDFLSPEAGREIGQISKIINAFFAWEFNSCECLVVDAKSPVASVHPIDFANACPDIAITSLHFYFPWAIGELLKWTTFCVASGRRPQLDLQTRRYFQIADDESLSYNAKLDAYEAIADEYFQTADYAEFCAGPGAHIDAVVAEYVKSSEFDDLLVQTVRGTYPAHEQEKFIAHFRGLIALWSPPVVS